jgi:hypothetical protein
MIKNPNPTSNDASEVLTKFEIDNIPEHYREYYEKKRHNCFASIQAFPSIWKCLMLLDKILLREFDDCQNVSGTEQMPPLLLYMNAHSKVRIALELGFSTSPSEAFSIMRDAVESAAFAHKLLSDPTLVQIWLEKDSGKVGADRFTAAFVQNRQSQLFSGLPELYDLWKQFSDIGVHTTLNSLMQCFVIEETPTHVGWRYNYTGPQNAGMFAGSLFMILLAIYYIERTVFNDFYGRLHLDSVLVEMRSRFENDKEACRKEIRERYRIPPPSATP